VLKLVYGMNHRAIQIIGGLAALDAVDVRVSQSSFAAHPDVVTPLVLAVVLVRYPQHRNLAQAWRQRGREQQVVVEAQKCTGEFRMTDERREQVARVIGIAALSGQ
jgi:hypothetical protein